MPQKKVQTDVSFDGASLTPSGLAATRDAIENELDAVATIGREHDDEPDDSYVADDGEEFDPKLAYNGVVRRPLRRFLKLRRAGESSSQATRSVGGVSCVGPTEDVTRARVKFAALCIALFHVDQEEALACATLEMWTQATQRTRTLRKVNEQWQAHLAALDDGIDSIIRTSGGYYATELPDIRLALAHLDVGLHLRSLEKRLGHALARISPDTMNVARGTGGRASRYSLGRLIFSLRSGEIKPPNGQVERRVAYSDEECMRLIVDDASPAAVDGRDQRYRLAEQRYTELHNELFPESAFVANSGAENSEMEIPSSTT